MTNTNPSNLSRSQKRQKCLEENLEIDPLYVDPVNKENNLEWDLRGCDWICEKTRQDPAYAQNLYASMCNNQFQKLAVWEILKEQTWRCSWRYAGGIVADMREQGDYMDWYCSGIQEVYEIVGNQRGYVPESTVTAEIQHDLRLLGWTFIPDADA